MLETFNDGSQVMQAVRELTNELFNLKNRTQKLEDTGAALAIPDPEAADAGKVLGVDSDGDYELQIPYARKGTGTNSLLITDETDTTATSSATRSIAMGYDARATLANAVSIGPYSRVASNDSVAIGYNAVASATAISGVAIGLSARVTVPRSVVLGPFNADVAEAVFMLGNGTTGDTRNTYFYIGYDETASEYYIMLQGGEKLYASKIAQLAVIPDAPTTDGVYKLNCTVSSGEASYAWTADV